MHTNEAPFGWKPVIDIGVALRLPKRLTLRIAPECTPNLLLPAEPDIPKKRVFIAGNALLCRTCAMPMVHPYLMRYGANFDGNMVGFQEVAGSLNPQQAFLVLFSQRTVSQKVVQ